MKYQYRWIYAGLINAMIMIFGFIYTLYPDFEQAIKWHHENKLMRQALAKIKKSTPLFTAKNFISKSQNKWDVLDYVLTLTHLHGLTVQSIKWITKAGEPQNTKVMQMSLRGKFQQFSAFIFSLNQSSSSLFVHDFDCKLDPQDALLKLEISIPQPYQQNLALPLISKSSLNDPLCSGEAPEPFYEANENKLANTVSVYSLRMVGFLKQNLQKQALLLLPTHDLIAVQKDRLIGQEKAKILEIFEDKIIFLLPNKKTWIVNM